MVTSCRNTLMAHNIFRISKGYGFHCNASPTWLNYFPYERIRFLRSGRHETQRAGDAENSTLLHNAVSHALIYICVYPDREELVIHLLVPSRDAPRKFSRKLPQTYRSDFSSLLFPFFSFSFLLFRAAVLRIFSRLTAENYVSCVLWKIFFSFYSKSRYDVDPTTFPDERTRWRV